MPVKAVVLAAGSGARLRPLSPFIPKEMLPLRHFPVIHHVLSELLQVGVSEVMIVISKEKESLREYCMEEVSSKGEDAARYSAERTELLRNLRISFAYQRSIRGTGDAIYAAKDFMGEDPLIVVYPDDLLPQERRDVPASRRLIEAALETGKNVILAEEIPLSEASSYGVIDFDGETLEERTSVRAIIEKPRHFRGTRAYAMVGRMVLTPRLVKSIPTLPIGDDTGVIPALNRQAERGELIALPHHGVRLDVGSHAGYERAVDYYRKRE